MLTISSSYAHDILAVVASGRVTHQDFESYLVPAIEAKLQDHASIRLWYEFAPDFEGVSIGALWDDAVLGLFHFNDFSRVVMIADEGKIGSMVNALACMLPCPVGIFAVDAASQAKIWLNQ